MAKIPDNKVFSSDQFVVLDGDGNSASSISNFKITVVQGQDEQWTAWAATFDVLNTTQAVDKERGNTALFVDFLTREGGPVPTPNANVTIFEWRNHCYRGDESHRRSDGQFNVPYVTFVGLADSIRLRHSGVSGEIGPC
jgi:hypothetical protein